MRNIQVVVLLLLLCVAAPGVSHARQTTHSREEIEKVLADLDKAIAEKSFYQERRRAKADSLERIVYSCHSDLYVDCCKELYGVLASLNGRQALKVLQQLEKTEEYASDVNLRAWVALNASQVYSTIGLYNKADELTGQINPEVLSEEEQLHYYVTCGTNYERVSKNLSDISIAQDEELHVLPYFRHIEELLPPGFRRNLVSANKEIYLNNPKRAMELLEKGMEKASEEERKSAYLTLAATNKLLGNPQNYIYYLALAALHNTQEGVTKYEALPYLVHALYDYNDIDRAYRYLMCAMEDANVYPSRNLALDVSRYFPLISSAYGQNQQAHEENNKMKRTSITIAFVFLALALLAALYLGYRQNRAQEERKRANQLQEALDQAAVADRIKSVFIQNMRHEIRTPLNTIVGFAQLMTNDLTDEERSLYNGYIMESNSQLLSTLDDIIDVSNMEVGTFNFKFGDIDLDGLCRKELEDHQDKLQAGVKLKYAPTQESIVLNSDQKRIAQVLQNMLSNACKNTSSGEITVEVEELPESDSVRIAVTDTGTGIPPEKTDVLFEHFEKIDHYSPGLGLGLYVSRLIARALGGEIYLDTHYTGGARFVFTIPNHKVDKTESGGVQKEKEKEKANEGRPEFAM